MKAMWLLILTVICLRGSHADASGGSLVVDRYKGLTVVSPTTVAIRLVISSTWVILERNVDFNGIRSHYQRSQREQMLNQEVECSCCLIKKHVQMLILFFWLMKMMWQGIAASIRSEWIRRYVLSHESGTEWAAAERWLCVANLGSVIRWNSSQKVRAEMIENIDEILAKK